MRQLKAVDVVIAGGGFVGLTLAKGDHRAHVAVGGGCGARPAAQALRLRGRNG